MSGREIVEMAGRAVEVVSTIEGDRPGVINILLAFSLATGFYLAEVGGAKPMADREVAINGRVLNEIYPDIQKGMASYFRVAEGGGRTVKVEVEDFFKELLPTALGVVFDVKLARRWGLAQIDEVLSSRWKVNWEASTESERRQLLLITHMLFNQFREEQT